MPKLLIQLISCKNLPNLDKFGESDAYVTFITKERPEGIQSKVIKNNLNPVFNQSFSFYVKTLKFPIEIIVKDYDSYKKDDVIGLCSLNISKISLNKWEKMNIKLFNEKSKGEIELSALLTNNACSHQKVFCEIQGHCCKKFFGCKKCHDAQSDHPFGVLKMVRCLNCLLEQPRRGKCLSCDMKFAPYYCEHCADFFETFDETNPTKHCFDCEKCITPEDEDSKIVKDHKHFLFTSKDSELVRYFKELRENILRSKEYESFFLNYAKLYQLCFWIEYFVENKLCRSATLQCQDVIDVIQNTLMKGKTRTNHDDGEKFLKIVSAVSALKFVLDRALKKNKNVRRTELKLSKLRILHKMSFISKIQMNIRKKKFVEKHAVESKQKIEEIDDDNFGESVEMMSKSIVTRVKRIAPTESDEIKEYLNLRIKKILSNKKLDKIYEYIDERDGINDLLKRSFKNYIKEAVTEEKVKIDPNIPVAPVMKENEKHVLLSEDFFETEKISILQYLVGKMLKIEYVSLENLKTPGKHSLKEKEEEFLEEYMKVFGVDQIQIKFCMLYALLWNFQDDHHYLNMALFYLKDLENTINHDHKTDYTHIVGIKELYSFGVEKMKEVFLETINSDFEDIEIISDCFEKLGDCWNLIITGNKVLAREEIEKIIDSDNFYEFASKRLVECEKDGIFKNLVILKSILEKVREISDKQMDKFFMKRFKFDLLKAFCAGLEGNVKELILEIGLFKNVKKETIPVEFYRQLLPTIFDLKKFFKLQNIDVAKMFYDNVVVSLRQNLKKKLGKWVQKAVEKEDYDLVDKSSEISHTHYSNNVVEIVFQPIDVVFEIDCISRESKGYQKPVLLEYFVIMEELFSMYTRELNKIISKKLASYWREREKMEKVNLSDFLEDFLKLKDHDEEKMEFLDEEELKKVTILANNIQNCCKKCTKLFLNSDIEEFLRTNLETGEEDGPQEYILDVVEIKKILDSLTLQRDECAKIIADYLVGIFIWDVIDILNFKEGEENEGKFTIIAQACDAFFDKLGKRIGMLNGLIYYRVFKKVLFEFYSIVLMEVINFIFMEENLEKDYFRLKNNAVYFMKCMENFFYADGNGLSKASMNIENQDCMEILNLLDYNPSALQNMFKEQKGGRLSMYILKLMKVQGNKEQKQFANDILPDNVKPHITHSLSRTLSSNEMIKGGKKRMQEKASLFLQLVKGTDLPGLDFNGLSDPYVEIVLGDQKNKSTKKKRTKNPVWNEDFIFRVDNLENDILKMKVLDYDSLGKDDFIGNAFIDDLDEIPFDTEVVKVIDLKRKKEKGKGKIEVKIKMTSI